MRTKLENYASEFLTSKMSLQLGQVIKSETGEETIKEIKLDPSIVWTVEEDIVAKKEEEEEALNPKGKKGAPASKGPQKK